MKIKELTEWLDNEGIMYDFFGDGNNEIEGFSSLYNYKKNTLTWIQKKENYQGQNIKCCICAEKIEGDIENQIVTDESKRAFFGLIDNKISEHIVKKTIGNTTFIGNDVKIGRNVEIGCNCTIDGDIEIGDNSIIGNNVVIVNKVRIGKNCEVQALTVIGEAGFGYYEANDAKIMLGHHGGVFIGDNVFVGSHVNIARGTIDDTIIEDGVKIAPSTHIGHNNKIKKNATIICSKLFGSVEIGENAYVSSCTIRNQCKIGDNSLIGMGAVVTHDIGNNKIAIGIPAKEIRDIV